MLELETSTKKLLGRTLLSAFVGASASNWYFNAQSDLRFGIFGAGIAELFIAENPELGDKFGRYSGIIGLLYERISTNSNQVVQNSLADDLTKRITGIDLFEGHEKENFIPLDFKTPESVDQIREIIAKINGAGMGNFRLRTH